MHIAIKEAVGGVMAGFGDCGKYKYVYFFRCVADQVFEHMYRGKNSGGYSSQLLSLYRVYAI